MFAYGNRRTPRPSLFLSWAWLVIGIASMPLAARAEPAVDLQLVIAADVSTSMDVEEKKLQQQGFVQAFRNPDLIRAILAGTTGRISVAYFEWGGDRMPRLVVPWSVIDGTKSSLALAQRLEDNFPSRMPRGTSIGMALNYAAYLLQSSGYETSRNIINISGDGTNNNQPDLAGVRQSVLRQGVTINGMPIVYKGLLHGVIDGAELDFPPEFLIDYFRNEVIGGPGAFIEPVTARQDYSTAILRKLMREISGGKLTIGSLAPVRPRAGGAPVCTAASCAIETDVPPRG